MNHDAEDECKNHATFDVRIGKKGQNTRIVIVLGANGSPSSI